MRLIQGTAVKARSSSLASVIVGVIAVVVLAPLFVATLEAMVVPAAIAVAVLVGLRLLWYWTSL